MTRRGNFFAKSRVAGIFGDKVHFGKRAFASRRRWLRGYSSVSSNSTLRMRSFLLLRSVLYADREGACMALGWELALRIIFYGTRNEMWHLPLDRSPKAFVMEGHGYHFVHGYAVAWYQSHRYCCEYVGLQNGRMRVLFLAAVMQ